MEIDFDKLLLSPFIAKIDSGLAIVAGGVLVFATILALIDFTLTMIRTVENRDQLITAILERMLKYAFWFGIITNYTKIKEILLDTFIGLASLFTDSKIDTSTIIGDVYNSNMANINKILDAANAMTGFGNAGWKLLYYCCWVLAFVLLIWVLVSIIFSFIAFHFVIGIAIIFICFATFDGTASLGEKFITSVTGAGMNLAVILIIQAISNNVMQDYLFPGNAVSSSVNKPQLIFGWMAIYSVCGYLVTKASSLAGIITAGAGEGLSATGLGKAMIGQISAVVAVTGAAVTAGAASVGAVAGAASGATSGTVSQAMNAGNSAGAVNGSKMITSTIKNGASSFKYTQGTVNSGGNWQGAKSGFKKGVGIANKSKAVMKKIEKHVETGIKAATGEDDRALLKGAFNNTISTVKDTAEYTVNNIDNVMDEVKKGKGMQNLYTSIMKGSIKTFKESQKGKEILKIVNTFKDSYKKMKKTSSIAIDNIKKTTKWTNEKTKNIKKNSARIFKKIYEHFKKRNNMNNQSDSWNRTKYDKDSWE